MAANIEIDTGEVKKSKKSKQKTKKQKNLATEGGVLA